MASLAIYKMLRKTDLQDKNDCCGASLFIEYKRNTNITSDKDKHRFARIKKFYIK